MKLQTNAATSTNARSRRTRAAALAFAATFVVVLGSLPVAAHAEEPADVLLGTQLAQPAADAQPAPLAAQVDDEQQGTFKAMVEASWVDADGNAIAWPDNTVVVVDLLREGKVIDENESRELGYVDGSLHTSNEFSQDCEVDFQYQVSVRSITPAPDFKYEVAEDSTFSENGELVFHLTFKKLADEKPEIPGTPAKPEVSVVLAVTPRLETEVEFPFDGVEYEFELRPRVGRSAGGRSLTSPGERHSARAGDGQPAKFKTITYTEPGMYQYTIVQRSLGLSGVTYDRSDKWAQVLVTMKDEKLEAAVTYGLSRDACTDDSLVVTNYYRRGMIKKDVLFEEEGDILFEAVDGVDVALTKPGAKGLVVGLVIRVPENADRVLVEDWMSVVPAGLFDKIARKVQVVDIGVEQPDVMALLENRNTIVGNDLVSRQYAYPIVENGYEHIAEAAGELDAQAEAEGAHLSVNIPDATELRGHWIFVSYPLAFAEGTDMKAVAAALEVPASFDVYSTDEEGNEVVTSTSVSDVPSVTIPEEDLAKDEEEKKDEGGAQPGGEQDGGVKPSSAKPAGQKESGAPRSSATKPSALPATGDAASPAAAVLLAGAAALSLALLLRRKRS